MSKICFDIEPKTFLADAQAELNHFSNRFVPTILSRIVEEQIDRYLDNLLQRGVISRRSKIHKRYSAYNERPVPLDRLARHPVTALAEFELKFSRRKELPALILANPATLVHCAEDPLAMPDRYNYYTPDAPTLESSTLKTSVRYRIRLNDIGIPGPLVLALRDQFPATCHCLPDHLVPICGHRTSLVPGLWFSCKICGNRYVCECFRSAHEIRYGHSLSRFSYREEICHLCRGIPSEMRALHPMYGSQVRVQYAPYIEKTVLLATGSRDSLGDKASMRKAENNIRDLIGVPRIGEGWVAEMDLLLLVRSCFPRVDVTHQASPPWLGRQRFDIYIPSLSLAIEYQGKQHFEPVEFFGGEDGFNKTVKLDKQKKKLAEENGVVLEYFRYDEKVSLSTVRKRLRKYL